MRIKKKISVNNKSDSIKVKGSLKSVNSKVSDKKNISKKDSFIEPKKKPKRNLKISQEVSQISNLEAKEVDKTKKNNNKQVILPKKKPENINSKDTSSLINVKTRKKRKQPVRVKLTKNEAISKGMNSKKTFTLTESRYDEIKGYLDSRGDEYDVVISGTTEKIKLNNRTYVPFDSETMIGSGYHLAKMVRSDIEHWLDASVRVSSDEEVRFFGKKYGDDWLSKNNSTLVKRGRDYSEQAFNVNAIENNINKILVSIDINDCYWQTGFNRGWFTEKTYTAGLRKKEWKIGRNASIGSLCKVEMITTYRGGIIARDSLGKIRRRIIRKEAGFQYVRHNIIGYVCDMFIELANILGDDFFMYLTDCVFTTMERKKEVEDFFKKHGYSCKSKTFEFTNVYRDDRVVEWAELREPDTLKYYRYALGQMYIPKQINNKLIGK